jgi:branched-chain amino acid transport system substrate-binding protein
MLKRRVFLLSSVLGGALLSGCGGSGDNGGDGSIPPPQANEFRIGALLSLTGNWNTLGRASKAAVELAQEDVNAYLAGQGSATRVRVVVADTKLEGDRALTEMRRLETLGAKVFVGPQSSSEVAALRTAANTDGTVLISQGSTASSLSIADDNVFRLVPDDVREARALVALLKADGVDAIVPVAREDAGNVGLFDSTRAAFAEGGGHATTGVKYATTTTAFGPVVDAIKAQVQAHQAQDPGETVAVYLAGFDEVAGLLEAAKNDSVLSAVKWYGSDGVVFSQPLIENRNAATFATQAGYPNPIFGLDDAMVGAWSPIAQRIKTRSGVDADAFALSAYDAVWVAALAHRSAGGTGNIANFKAKFVETANSYTGVTGSTKLSAAGDRDSGNFDFWSIATSGNSFRWKRTAVYRASDGQIVRTP